ncbi:MAG: hypothetical protein AAF657_01030 [Acidobacteriota bacterium]
MHDGVVMHIDPGKLFVALPQRLEEIVDRCFTSSTAYLAELLR